MPIFRMFIVRLMKNLSTLLITILLEWSAKDLEMLQANIAFRLQHTTLQHTTLQHTTLHHTTYYLKFQNSKL